MTGADQIKVPDQSLNMGTQTTKKASDLISGNVKINWTENNGTVSGDVKYIADFSELFGSGDQKSGHFFPIAFDAELEGRTLTVSGRVDGDRNVLIDSDHLLIVRLENFSEPRKVTVKDVEDILFTLDFSNASLQCPVGESAFKADKTNYGRFGDTTKFYKDVKLAWNGTTATVTGTLNFIEKEKETGFTSLSSDGNYFAFALTDWFNEKSITVEGNNTKTAAATDWVMLVTETSKSKGIKVKYEDTLIAAFDLSQVTLGAKAAA